MGGRSGAGGASTADGATGGSAGTGTDGGAGGSAGTSGSAGQSGAGGSPPPAGCNGALLCDDFESYAPMTAPNGKWRSTTVGAATLVVDTLHAYSGAKAVHFHGKVSQAAPREQAYLLAQGAPVFPVAGRTLFVRFMMYIQRYPDSAHTRLVWVGSSNALNNPDRAADGQGYVLAHYNGIAIERLSSGFFRDTSKHFADAARVGKWHCFEFEIDNAGGPPAGGVGTALPHIWEDGVAYNLALAGSTTVAYNAVPFEGLLFSLWSPQTDTGEADFWFDDVAMSTQRINCPAAP